MNEQTATEPVMTPAEAIAMRNKLAKWARTNGWITNGLESEFADDMIKTGWVTAEPETPEAEPEAPHAGPGPTYSFVCRSTNMAG